ncbi:hypothetical protein [Paraburkholderia graminis]|uniref:Uncharacterized protein n=1 Tax=Paraburkholderia graminis TaxID=60548 RepID=A0ABD5CST5_9BURK|nr:hypothetical protein [Paraburkholderia graminis]MDR6208209.1 hypothetical protein [Paraburkholderia graminis]
MSLQLTDRLRENLEWLALKWEANQLQHISTFNNELHVALRSVLAGNPSRPELELLINGTRGKPADGYAHLLVGDPERVAEEPFIALRILGEISTDLAHAVRA